MARLTKLRLTWVKYDQRFEVTGFSDAGLHVLQREIHRLMGRCLLLVQTYERLMKAVVAQHDISGSAQSFDKAQAARADDISRKTLGTLVNQLLVTFLTTDEKARSAEEPAESLDTGPQATVQMQLILSADDFARTENALRELMLLRNNLVHNFLEQHYLTSLDGCRAAEEAMITASGRIKQHFDGLRQWTEDLERSGLRFAEVIKSDAFHDLLVHGAMPWPITAIVIALREAAEELSLDGWAPVERAGEWVSARYPRRHPPITNATAMRVTAIQTQTERKPQDRSVRRVEKRSRQARMMRVRGPIRPAPGVCAAADAARGEKSLFRGKNQAILVSSGRQLGECRVIAGWVFLVDWSDWSDIMNWKAEPCH